MSDEKKPSELKKLTKEELKALSANSQRLVEQYTSEIFKQQGVIAVINHIISTYNVEETQCAATKPILEVK